MTAATADSYARPGRAAPDAGWLGRAIRRLQLARMTGVLTRFDDALLADLGITRDQIPAHAERLLAADRAD